MTDIWSSAGMKDYLGITLSGVTENFESFTCLFDCKKIEDRHTGAKITADYEELVAERSVLKKLYFLHCFSVLQILNKLSLLCQVIRAATDNASNIKFAFNLSFPHYLDEDEALAGEAVESEELEDDDQGKTEDDVDESMGIEIEIDANGKYQEDNSGLIEIEMELRNVFTSGRITLPGMPTSYNISFLLRSSCLAHTLQLVVKDGLTTLGAISKEAIKKVSRVVSRKSTLDTEILDKSVNFRIPPTNATR